LLNSYAARGKQEQAARQAAHMVKEQSRCTSNHFDQNK